MILEIFGAPGVGKTTFAIALADHLREGHLQPELAISYRPAELTRGRGAEPSPRGQAAWVVRRLTRPVRELFATGSNLPASRGIVAPADLMRLLPPRSVFWSLRLRQYIWRLSRGWELARLSDRCVIYDQAFVQLVCSLALLTDRSWREQMALALHLIPRPDVLIRLEAPRDLLRARLIERERQQTRLEHLLEFDLATNLRSIDVIEEIHAVLAQQGQPIHCLACMDPATLRQAVESTEGMLIERRRNAGLAA
jgi:hypothetical protein